MVEDDYCPSQSDLVWVNFSPAEGNEQKGRRPAMVLSSEKYNKKSGLMLACPVTSQEKGYPFEVKINNSEIRGVALADQIKTLDWQEREIDFIESVDSTTCMKIIKKTIALFDI